MRHHLLALPCVLVLSACGDPLSGIERVSEMSEPLAQDTTVAAFPSPEEIDNDTPVLAGLLTAEVGNATTQATEAPSPDAVTQSATASLQPAPPADATQQPAGGGLLGWLRATAPTAAAQDAKLKNAADDAPTPRVIPAALTVDEVDPAPRRGLSGFARTGTVGTARRSGADARDVPVGTVLPFGEIARVCDARPRDMGRIVEKAARKGKGYVLHDTAPDSAAPRTFYVTGFADNCPRQLTAALALFGTPAMHEKLRYGLPAQEYPYSKTDEAYEKLKMRVCNVGRSKPCGDRVSRLEKTTVFVSVYENFGENARWADLLLHEGRLVATAIKSP